MLIDSHCHLDFDVFNNDRAEVIQRAQANNISDIIVPGTEKRHWERIRSLCASNGHLHACYGLHPYWANRHNKTDITALEKYIEMHRPVAVGECGLDFRANQPDRQLQLYFFEAQLAIAESNGLPVIIHAVKATEMVIRTIRKFNRLTGMIHSYSGSLEQARQLVALNFLISISAGVTYENAKKLHNIARQLPLTSLLLETDAPDQPDSKHTGSRNEPAYMINTLAALARIRDESEESIAEATSRNARSLFNI